MKSNFIDKMKSSSLLKDSMWAMSGNVIGYGLLLFAGIIIARYLGKDVYGEYGLVKSTMFYLGSFASFGLSITATKYVAQIKESNVYHIKQLVYAIMKIACGFSVMVAIILFLVAETLAEYLGNDGFTLAFRVLGIVIVLRAVNLTQTGILAGLKLFKYSALSNVWSGITMLVTSVPLTYIYGLNGAFIALLLSQFVACLFNYFSVKREMINMPNSHNKSYYEKEILRFSFPIALHETLYMICGWGTTILLTKLSSVGELGIYTATNQWNAVIAFIPLILSNIVLSYLSSNVDNKKKHELIFRRMLLANFIAAFIPFIVFYVLSDLIVSFYGNSFIGMKDVFNISIFSTISMTLGNVLSTELLSRGKKWIVLMVKGGREIMTLLLFAFFLIYMNGIDGAKILAILNVLGYTLYFLVLLAYKKYNNR